LFTPPLELKDQAVSGTVVFPLSELGQLRAWPSSPGAEAPDSPHSLFGFSSACDAVAATTPRCSLGPAA